MNHRDRERFWRLLLLFPRDFRQRWGRDMEALCAHRMESAGSDPLRRGRAWLGVCLDAVGGAAKEWATRAAIGRPGWPHLRHDVEHALRGLASTPGATAIATATLALAIGANATTFSVVYTVMLAPPPFEDPDRVVAVWPVANFNTALVREFEQGAPALERVAGFTTWTAVLSGAGDPLEIDVARVSPAFFPILGVEPAHGRVLLEGESVEGRTDVVLLSHELWSSRFGSDPGVVGRRIELSLDESASHLVAGVMPPGFEPVQRVDAWAPLPGTAESVTQDRTWYVNERIARLARGATVEQATQQVRALAARFAPDVPNQFSDEIVAQAEVVPLHDSMIGHARAALWVLLGSVGLVLLIACANVANLLLARGEARRHDLAVRVALGASRFRIVRLLLAEAVVLCGAGGALGVLAAIALRDVVVAFAPAELPRIQEVSVSWTVIGFTLAAALVAAFLSGLWPAWRCSRADLTGGLGRTRPGAAGRSASRAASQGLIAVEMALAVVVTLGSALMMKSLNEMLNTDVGFDAQGVVVFRPNILGSGRSGAERVRAFYAEILDRVRSGPGVQEAGAVQILTGTPNNWNFPIFPEDYEIPASGAAADANFRAVLPGYFETLRIPLLRGRTIGATDREGSEPVVVVNRALVERFWPGQAGLGKTIRIFSTDAQALRVVGVVGDIRQHGLDYEPRAELYVPFLAWEWEMSAWIMARTSMPEAFKASARGIVDQVAPGVAIGGLDDLDRVVDRSADETRFFAVLLTAFGLLGLTLGAIGIYGVTAYSVARRRGEFGVRLALGASRGSVIGSAIRSGVGPVLLGAAAGLVASLGGTRWLEGYLFEVGPTDPSSYLAATIALGLVAGVALAVPAWRAGRVDPADVLRAE